MSNKLLCCVSSAAVDNRQKFRDKMEEMDDPGTLIAPSCWVNHNKDICHIKNYYTDRNHAELILFRQEMQIQNSCEYCLTCDKCKKYLLYSREFKNKGFWTHKEKTKIWEIFDPDWSYKNETFEIKPCNNIWFEYIILQRKNNRFFFSNNKPLTHRPQSTS